MEFRKAEITDLEGILEIIKQAQDYLKKMGINQWQNNYPNAEVITYDIEKKRGYVLVDGDVIVGTVSVSFDREKTYDYIEGEWLSGIDYAVVHRIAVRSEHKGKGLASVILKNIEHICLQKGIHSIKIDTHEDNKSMQRLLQKNSFTYCGVIYLQDGSKRLAYEKLLNSKQGR
ncbi:MAG: GNAT family N-acetyltransferase [Clostridiaceae bacterium]|nr:GNAT family N-acetyltransferase [Clostridiaceae bacterium]